MKKKIAVSGANGQLGQEIKALENQYKEFEFLFFTREELSISDEASVNAVFHKHHPHYFINCAAYTAVDKAESEKENAFAVNAKGTEFLADAAKKSGCRLIHISTDYVFEGTGATPYKTDTPANPQSVYGASKQKGEELAMASNTQTIIIRTSWVYSEFGKNFVKTMMKLMTDKPEIGVVADQIGSPTYAADLAKAILEIISSGKWKGGIYHYSNKGIISWHEFALAIKELIGSECKVNAITTDQYPTPAKRPSFSGMDTSKIQMDFQLQIPEWKVSLQRCIQRLKTNQ